jgi:hypothetical protein
MGTSRWGYLDGILASHSEGMVKEGTIDAVLRQVEAQDDYEPRVQILRAIDWENAGRDPQPIIDFINRHDALIEHKTVEQPHWKTGDPQTVHLFTFDAKKVRNTEVHGAGYHAGFVVNIEDSADRPQATSKKAGMMQHSRRASLGAPDGEYRDGFEQGKIDRHSVPFTAPSDPVAGWLSSDESYRRGYDDGMGGAPMNVATDVVPEVTDPLSPLTKQTSYGVPVICRTCGYSESIPAEMVVEASVPGFDLQCVRCGSADTDLDDGRRVSHVITDPDMSKLREKSPEEIDAILSGTPSGKHSLNPAAPAEPSLGPPTVEQALSGDMAYGQDRLQPMGRRVAWNPGREQMGDFPFFPGSDDIDEYIAYRKSFRAQGMEPMTLNRWRKAKSKEREMAKRYESVRRQADYSSPMMAPAPQALYEEGFAAGREDGRNGISSRFRDPADPNAFGEVDDAFSAGYNDGYRAGQTPKGTTNMDNWFLDRPAFWGTMGAKTPPAVQVSRMIQATNPGIPVALARKVAVETVRRHGSRLPFA